MSEQKNKSIISRPPIVAVMGHIDHGKSTLLDYIRKTNIVDSETGGITQRLSAYEVLHKDENGVEKKITFLDTPGHEAFSQMRERGATVADVAILVVSAEDGVKPQTIEAWKTITASNTLPIVAINKIDKPGANIEKTKTELAENEIYLENYGGKVPYAEISAKTGAGIDNLLSLILILAEMENWTGDLALPASGYVVEANQDAKRGIQATIIIKDGSVGKGMTVAVGNSLCSTRLIENFKGEQISEAAFSSPIRIFGFDKMPNVGMEFKSFYNKKDAEKYAADWQTNNLNKGQNGTLKGPAHEGDTKKIIPIVLKADVSGSLEAIEKEIAKINSKASILNAQFRIVTRGTGPISESDIKNISNSTNVLIIGFNVKADKNALEIAEKRGIPISFFDIIYKMTEWLEAELETRRPKVETVETTGRAKIIRAFSRTKERQIVGGKVSEGIITLGSTVKIMRREFEIGRGKIINLEKGKVKTSEVAEGTEFGMMIESKIEIVSSDVIEAFSTVHK